MDFLYILLNDSFSMDDKACKKSLVQRCMVWQLLPKNKLFKKNQNISKTCKDIDLILFIKDAPLKTQRVFRT